MYSLQYMSVIGEVTALPMCMFSVFVHYTLIDVATFLACSYS